MANRIPFLAGGTKGRDHFQFRTSSLFGDSGFDHSDKTLPYQPDDGGGSSEPLSDFGSPSASYDLDKALKWLWKVREWTFGGSFANILGGTTGIAGLTASPYIFGSARGSGSVDSETLTSHQKTGPTGVHAYLGAVDPQPECDEERQLLDSFKDAEGNVIFTRGNFGAVKDRPSLAYPDYASTDALVNSIAATAAWTFGTRGAGPVTDEAFITSGPDAGKYAIRTMSITPLPATLIFAVGIKRWDPKAPHTKEGMWNSNVQDDIIWRGPSDNGKFLIPVRFFVGLNMPYHVYVNDDIWSARPADGGTLLHSVVLNDEDHAGSVPLGFASDGPFTLSMDGDDRLFRWGADDSATASFDLNPSAYWPYQNRLGQPVYDESSGAQVNDPLA